MGTRHPVIERLDTPKLWRLALAILDDMQVKLTTRRASGDLRRSCQNLENCLLELRMRGIQLELDLGKSQQVARDSHID
jgi:hypothetical protein